MNEILVPPAERDLPSPAAARMRGDLIRAAGHRPAPRARLGIAFATVALLVVGTGAVSGIVGREYPGGDGTRFLAMGPGELSPTLRDAAESCLAWMHKFRSDPSGHGEQPVPVSLTDVAVAMERGDRTVVLFLNDLGYATCDRRTADGREPSGALDWDRWTDDDWMPGPVQRFLLTSTEADGGEVSVSGRVSPRVARLLLDHGDGRRTVARISAGAFGILTADDSLRLENNPELVSYDAQGVEIDRRPLFQPTDQLEHCYVTPAGTVVYGKRTTGCLPAERWKR